MVGANYTGGRRNAAKARSKDTTGRLQRGHFSKQRLGILTDALRARRADHHSLSHDPNLVSDPRPGSLVSLFGHSVCAPAATVYDISLGHAKRDLAQKQRQKPQAFRLRQNDGYPLSLSGEGSLDQSDQNDTPTVTSIESSASLALTEKGEPGSVSGLYTLIPATTPTVNSSCSTPPPQSTPVTEISPRQRSNILDSLDVSGRKYRRFLRTLVHHNTLRHLPHILPYTDVHFLNTRSRTQFIPFPDHHSHDHACSTNPSADAGILPFPARSLSLCLVPCSPFVPFQNIHLFSDCMLRPCFVSFSAELLWLTTLQYRNKHPSSDRPNTFSAKLAWCLPLSRYPATLPLS